MSREFADNPAYAEYQSLLSRLHLLIAEGKGDSVEADAVRDAMDAPEQRLTRRELERLNGLSSDLYMLNGAEVLAKSAGPGLDAAPLYERIREAQTNADWETVLKLLRERSPGVPAEAVAFSRARAYEALGHVDVALLFLSYASMVNRREPLYEVIRLDLLRKTGRLADAAALAEHHLREPSTPPLLVIAAADILFAIDGEGRQHLPPSPARAAQLLQRLEQALSPAEVIPGRLRSFVVIAHLLRAGCFEALSRPEDAARACEDALRHDPTSREIASLREALRVRANVATALGRALVAAEDRARSFEPVAA